MEDFVAVQVLIFDIITKLPLCFKLQCLGEMTNLFFSVLTWRIFIGFSETGLAIGDEHRGLPLWCDLIGRTFVTS